MTTVQSVLGTLLPVLFTAFASQINSLYQAAQDDLTKLSPPLQALIASVATGLLAYLTTLFGVQIPAGASASTGLTVLVTGAITWFTVHHAATSAKSAAVTQKVVASTAQTTQGLVAGQSAKPVPMPSIASRPAGGSGGGSTSPFSMPTS